MGRLWLLCWLVLAAGCASWPDPGDPAQCPPAQSAQALLTLSGAATDNPRRLILHTRPGSQSVRYVAVDTVGSPLFTARWGVQDWQLEATGLYRGPPPAALVSAYQWWQYRHRLDEGCIGSAGLSLERTGAGLTIRRRGGRIWHWDSANDRQFQLPRQGITVTVREKP